MAHSRIELTTRGRLFLVLILFSLAATAYYLYLYGLDFTTRPQLQPDSHISTNGDEKEIDTLFSKIEEPEPEPELEPEPVNVTSLTYPLPLPYILRQQYTDKELEKFIPDGCPALPWRRNLTEHPILIQGHNMGGDGRFSPQGKLLEGCRWPCLYSTNRDWMEVDAHFFDLLKSPIMTGTPIYDAQYGESHKRVCPMQRYMLFAMEADSYYPVVGDPKGPLFGFDVSMTYKLDSDSPAPYFSDTGYDLFKEPLSFEEKNKTSAYASAFISNCRPNNDRDTYQHTLQRLLQVDSFGGCFHNADPPPNTALSRWDFKQTWLRKYLFTLAFENSNTKDYVTEKIYQAFVAGTVPIYIGAPNIDELVPFPDSIIKAYDFKSPEDLAEHLKFLRQNPDEYNHYLEWKKRPPETIPEPFKSSLVKNHVDTICRVCGILAGEDVGWKVLS